MLDEIARCTREMAEAEALLRSGHPDVEGLLQELQDWSAERRIMSDVHVVDRQRLAEQNVTIRIEGARWERLRELEKAVEASGLTMEEVVQRLRWRARQLR